MDEKETRIDQIKDYIEKLFGQEQEIHKEIRLSAKNSGLPLINVPPHVGKLIYILTKLKNPKRVLEIGTLAGYSTIWIAQALSKEALIFSIDHKEHHLELAKKNFLKADVQDKIILYHGDALKILDEMLKSNFEKFDMIFIDADKENYLNYLKKIKLLANNGALILSDNLIPKWKAIGQPHPKDEMAKSIYAFNEKLVSDENLESAIISTLVGEISRIDGLGISIFNNSDN